MHKLRHLSKIRLQKFQQTAEYMEQKGNELDSSQQDYLDNMQLAIQLDNSHRAQRRQQIQILLTDRA